MARRKGKKAKEDAKKARQESIQNGSGPTNAAKASNRASKQKAVKIIATKVAQMQNDKQQSKQNTASKPWNGGMAKKQRVNRTASEAFVAHVQSQKDTEQQSKQNNKKKKGKGKNKKTKQPPKKASSHQYKRHPQKQSFHNKHSSHKVNLKRHRSKETRIPVKQIKFTLSLPSSAKNTLYSETPWYQSECDDDTNQSSDTSLSSTLSLLQHVSNEQLSRLDHELLAFCEYIRLSREECQAREYVIDHVQQVCQNLFEDNKYATNISIQAFGSFATPQVCTFQSDVDLALWGVIPTSTHTRFDSGVTNNVDVNADATEIDERKKSAVTDSTSSSSGTEKKEKRIQKWKEALAEHDAQERSDDEMLQQQQQDEKTTDNNVGSEKDTAVAADKVNEDAGNDGKQESSAAELGTANDEQNVPPPPQDGLFVIDRMGDEAAETSEKTGGGTLDAATCTRESDGNDQSNAATAASIPLPQEEQPERASAHKQNCTHERESVQEESLQESHGVAKDGNEQSRAAESVAALPAQEEQSELSFLPRKPDGSANAPLVVDNDVDGTAEAPLVIDGTSESDGADLHPDDSDADSADKLESYTENRAFGSNAADKPLESYRDSRAAARATNDDDDTTDDEDEMPLGQLSDAENDDLQVSFVSHASDDKKPAAVGPTGETRELVVSALKRLGKALWKSPVIHTVEVRRHARVPIIVTGTHLGFEGDIAVGGHNGADTSQYASSQARRFKSFAPVVLLLKVMLGQQALDKPFTGGLGSYKLYVLVAHHLEEHLANGGADRPSEVLAAFFFRFRKFKTSQKKKVVGKETPIETFLSQNKSIRCNGGSAELQPVFKLEHCCSMFDASWRRIVNELESDDSAKSFLTTLVHAKLLRKERDRHRNKASKLANYSQATEGRKSVWNADSSFKNTIAKAIAGKKRAAESEPVAGDADAAQLMAGYGMQRSPRGGLIPLHRPDVEARQSMPAEALGRATKNRKNKKKQKRDEGLKAIAQDHL